MSVSSDRLSDTDLKDLVQQMNTIGYAVIEDYVDTPKIESLGELCHEIVAKADNNTVILKEDERELSFMSEFARAPAVQDLCSRVCSEAGITHTQTSPLYHVLRCLYGSTDLGQSFKFHYDQQILTVLLPLVIPEKSANGRLVLIPNSRMTGRRLLAKLADRIFVFNRAAQLSIRTLYKLFPSLFVQVKLKPGHLYLFWGDKTLHTNEPSEHRALRATALFHYGLRTT